MALCSIIYIAYVQVTNKKRTERKREKERKRHKVEEEEDEKVKGKVNCWLLFIDTLLNSSQKFSSD